MGLEAGSQLKSQGKWLGVGGPSVGLYVPLLEFNHHKGARGEKYKIVAEQTANGHVRKASL